ncbi:PIG-L family deacetylase [Geodermatophilus sp. SYSU D00867]
MVHPPASTTSTATPRRCCWPWCGAAAAPRAERPIRATGRRDAGRGDRRTLVRPPLDTGCRLADPGTGSDRPAGQAPGPTGAGRGGGRAADADGVPAGDGPGVWAHPDDEAYLSAALMAEAGDAGADRRRGHRHRRRVRREGDGPVADLRRLEVVASLAAVGVTDHRWLGSRDGRCAAVPPDDGGRAVRALPEDVRPDTVVTFGRDGPSGRTPASAGGRRRAPAGSPHRRWFPSPRPGPRVMRFRGGCPVGRPADPFRPGGPAAAHRSRRMGRCARW